MLATCKTNFLVACCAGKGKQAAAGLLAVATLVATGQAKADEVDTVVEQAISAVKVTAVLGCRHGWFGVLLLTFVFEWSHGCHLAPELWHA